MKFDLLLEHLFEDLRLSLLKNDAEARLGIKQEFVKRLEGEFNQLQILIFCTFYDWMVVGNLIPKGSLTDTGNTKVMFMTVETTAGEKLRKFSFTDEFDELLHIHDVAEMSKFLDEIPNDYDGLHAVYKRVTHKYEPFLTALIDRLLDTNSPDYIPKFGITLR